MRASDYRSVKRGLAVTTAFAWRGLLLCVLLCAACRGVEGAEPDRAHLRYQARLKEIAQAYHRDFGEVRKSLRKTGFDKATVRKAEQQIKELAMTRSRALAEARAIYLREQNQTPVTPEPKGSRAERESALWTAQQRAVEEGQTGFWRKAARDDARDTVAWAAMLRAVEEGQTAFWAGAALQDAQDSELWALHVRKVEQEQIAFWVDLFGIPSSSPKSQ